ncbi:hypothetical protein ABN09_03485, partial [Morganella morganii]
MTEQQPARQRHHTGTEVEPGECRALHQRMHFHQPLVTDLADGKEDIRQLHQNQPCPERITEMVIADHRRTNHRQQRTEHISPPQSAPLQQIINQCH